MPFTEFFAQSGGSAMNGGSDANNAAAYTSTNGNWNGTTTYTPTDGSTPASTVVVGAFASVYIDGATVPVYHARVTAVAAGVNGAITLSTTSADGTAPTSSATARSIKVGGAWNLPSGATTFPLVPLTNFQNMTDAGGDVPRLNAKCGGAGGIDVALTTGFTNGVSGPYVIQGYKTAVGDGEINTDTQANQVNYKLRIDGSTNAIVLYTMNANIVRLDDIQFSNNGTTGSNNGLAIAGARVSCNRVIVHDVRGSGIQINGAQPTSLIECELYTCNTSNTAGNAGVAVPGSAGGTMIRCICHDNAGSNNNGVATTNPVQLIDCIFDTNGLYGVFLQGTGSPLCVITSCDFYNNAADGLRCASTSGAVTYVQNCNFEANGQSSGTGYGINVSGVVLQIVKAQNCRYFNNKTGTTNGFLNETGAITGTATAYKDPANGDFRLFGADALTARGAGRGRFLQTSASYAGSNSFPDASAVEHPDPPSGRPFMAASIGTY